MPINPSWLFLSASALLEKIVGYNDRVNVAPQTNNKRTTIRAPKSNNALIFFSLWWNVSKAQNFFSIPVYLTCPNNMSTGIAVRLLFFFLSFSCRLPAVPQQCEDETTKRSNRQTIMNHESYTSGIALEQCALGLSTHFNTWWFSVFQISWLRLKVITSNKLRLQQRLIQSKLIGNLHTTKLSNSTRPWEINRTELSATAQPTYESRYEICYKNIQIASNNGSQSTTNSLINAKT